MGIERKIFPRDLIPMGIKKIIPRGFNSLFSLPFPVKEEEEEKEEEERGGEDERLRRREKKKEGE